MNLLTCDNVQSLVADTRDRTQLWVFHHIPRTAGTSLAAEFSARLQPSYDILIPLEAIARDSYDADTEMDLAFRRFWDEQKKTCFRFISGHMLRPHIRQLRTLPDVRLVTMLRHPVEQIVSLYRFAQSPAVPNHRKFIRKYPDLDAFIEEPESQNRVAGWLGGPGATAAQCIEILSCEYLFCGLFEQLAVSFDMMKLLLGFAPSHPMAHLNESPEEVPNEVDDIGRHRDKILTLNAVDAEIYRFVQRQFQEKRQEMSACLSSHVPQPAGPELAAADTIVRRLRALVEEQDRQLRAADQDRRRLIGEVEERDRRLAAADMDRRRLIGEVDDRRAELEAIQRSSSWRMTGPLRRLTRKYPRLARPLRRGVGVVWRALTRRPDT
jgi:hypothetical protein